jgi:mannose-6-phosphate isomerase-like protein (cupin superfamily)
MAARPAGVSIWTAAELKAQGEKLASKMNEKKVASERLATYGNYLTMIAHREADGEAEIHETQADFFFVQSGTATLVFGGEVPGAKTTHQLLVPAGKEFTYFVIKIDTP